MRAGIVGWVALALVLAIATAAGARPLDLASQVVIHRDAYGVPHITGPTDASVVFGLAYAQAEDNFPHLEDTFIRATIFARWHGRMRAMNFPSDPDVPYNTLGEIRGMLEAYWNTWRVPWGEVNRLQRRHWSGSEAFDDALPSLPVRGAPGWLGVIFNFYTDNPYARQRAYGRMGNSYVSVVEFGRDRTQGRSIVDFGQSGRPESPHYFDQAPLYARGEFKPSPTTLAEVLEAAVRSYHPGEED